MMLLLALLLQLKPVQEPAKNRDFTGTVRFALGDETLGPWQTFVCEMDNRAPKDRDVEIRIEDPSSSTSVLRRERLSAGARKRIFLYAPGNLTARTLDVKFQIRDAGGEELVAGTLPLSATARHALRQVALLCAEDAGSRNSTFELAPGKRGDRLVRLSPASVPDRWIGLASLDLLIVYDAPLDELTIDQTRAIHDYVRQGGAILFMPGTRRGWLVHPSLQALAPVRSGEPVVLDPAQAPERFGVFSDPAPLVCQTLLNGVSILPHAGRPFVVRFDAGLGRAFVCAVDLERPPFTTMDAVTVFWEDLLRAAARDAVPDGIATSASQRASLLQTLARLVNPYPSLALITALALGYVLVVGPLNYWLLSRLGRSLLFVATVPAISLGFLLLVVVVGYVTKGASTVTHTARLLSTTSGASFAREVQLLTLFSPSNHRFDLRFAPGAFPLPAERIPSDGSNRVTHTPLLCESASSYAFLEVASAQWQTRRYEARAVRDLGDGVRFELSGPTLRVTNGSPFEIERGLCLVPGKEGRAIPFATIPAGKSAEIAVADAWSLFEALPFPPEHPGGPLLKAWERFAGERNRHNPTPLLLCVLRESEPALRTDAPLSSRSRAITLLQVEP